MIKEVCQRYFEIASSPKADSPRSRNESPALFSSENLDAENISGENYCRGSSSHPPGPSCKVVKSWNLSKASPQSKKREMVKVLSSSNSSNGEVVVKNSSSLGTFYIYDKSRGKEKVKISCTSEESLNFSYISQNLIYDKASVQLTLASISDEDCCSNCSKDCILFSVPCNCAKQTGGEFAYAPGGFLKESFLEECITSNQVTESSCYFTCEDCPLVRSNRENQPTCEGHSTKKFIKECWSTCGCGINCGNRVVQNGISVPLQVFQSSAEKGMGVRTLEDLPRGAFVCEYAGEVVTCSRN